jgi:hypothetical protein
MALQEQFADGERPRNDLAKEENATAAVEHRIDGIIGGAIRSKTQRWRRINWVDGGSRTQLATSDDRGCECGCNGNMQAHPWTQLQQARNDCQALLRRCGHRANRVSSTVGHARIRVQHCAAQLRVYADRIGIQRNECLVYALPCLEGANECEGGGIGAISGWGSQALTLGPTLHKDASICHGDELIKGSGGAKLRMEIGNTAQLFGERCRIKQLTCCMCRAGTSSGIRREELPWRNGLAMGHHKVTDERDLAAGRQPFDRWLAQSCRHGKSGSAVVVETPGHATCSASKADRRQNTG